MLPARPCSSSPSTSRVNRARSHLTREFTPPPPRVVSSRRSRACSVSCCSSPSGPAGYKSVPRRLAADSLQHSVAASSTSSTSFSMPQRMQLWQRASVACVLALLAASTVGAAGANVPDGGVESNAVEDVDRGGRAGAAGAARTVLAEMARELISRSATSSQVLSLNLTNLVILLVLKAVIFGAGHMGVGWAAKSSRGGEGPPPLVSEQEALLLLGFLMGGERDNYRCLNRVACQEPDAANSYARAGLLLSKGAKLLNGVVPYDHKYDHIVEGLVDAVEYGRRGDRCDLRYSCAR